MTAEEFVSRLGANAKPTKAASGWQARCPAHEDNRASLSVAQCGDHVLIHCFAGCTPEAVCDSIGLKTSDLFVDQPENNGRAKRIVATYDYRDENENLLFQVVRFDPKDFRQRRPDPSALDGWAWSTKGVRRVLYRLPEISRDVKRGLPVLIVEGEKDADALAKLGLSTTCNPGGAGKWREEYGEVLRGAIVFVVADKDKPGREHAQQVAASLHNVAKRIFILELPDRKGCKVKDAVDWLTAGGTTDELTGLLDATPEWKQPAATQRVESVVSSAADIRGEIIALLTDAKLSVAEQRTQIAEMVVRALTRRGAFFFHAERHDFDSAMFFDTARKRLERIRSDSFLAWLSDWLRVNRADTIFRFITAQIETAALSGEQTTGILPESFWVSRPGAIYLSNGDGALVKITTGNAELADNGTDGVLFAAGNTLAPWTLTAPQDPFVACSLFARANCIATHGPDLLRLWILSLPTNPASKPPLCLAGDIGSGKSRLAKGVAEFFGLPIVAHKVEDFGEDSFWASLDAGGLFTLDNCDTRNKWLPDAVASAATDGCSQRRKLYTDCERVTLRARAWLCLTTANPTFASDAGLADRLLVVRMIRRTDETSDAALSDEIRQHRDAGLSFVAHTLARALADTSPVPSGLNQRHPDFAANAVRIGRALGREADAMAAIRAAEADKASFCLENDAIGAALLAYLRRAGHFTGTAAELVPHLVAIDGDLEDRLSAKRLGKRLGALWPHLEKVMDARKEATRSGITRFTFRLSAGFAGFQTAFS